MSPSRLRHAHRLPLLALLLGGFALRLHTLGAESLWYDEAVSAYLAALPIPELIAHTARDIHPPAYYLLLHAWQRLTTPTLTTGLEYLYAWPSLWLSMLVLSLTYALTRRLYRQDARDRAALFALLLAAYHPFQIWFAQEVRMYALGALCVMLTWWALTGFLHRGPRLRNLTLYSAAALLGLYTFYYFLFWLLLLNLVALLHHLRQRGPKGGALWAPLWARLLPWLAAHVAIFVGWLPWLPTFLRQSLTPPVPPWRVPWHGWPDLNVALTEGLAGLWIAHLAPLNTLLPWALLIAALLAAALLHVPPPRLLLPLLTIGPLLLLCLVSLVGPPIYHVRYLAAYAPAVPILLAAVMLAPRPGLRAAQWLLAPGILLITAALSYLTLQQLWTSPAYTADDHRRAVADLAAAWRPGDAILVNAGWVYPAVTLYWPRPLPASSLPPPLAPSPRLSLVNELTADGLNSPTLVRTGSIDASPTLGWGLPQSDFYAISGADTTAALDQLAARATRIWHYRLYDTVSDPTGIIRAWLDNRARLVQAIPYPGSGYLRVELYDLPSPLSASPLSAPPPPAPSLWYPSAGLALAQPHIPAAHPAGRHLYIPLAWQWQQPPRGDLAVSLRLVAADGTQIAQTDVPVAQSAPDPRPGAGASWARQSLALAVPASTAPGDYTVHIVVYTPSDLSPFTPTDKRDTPLTTPTPLGRVAIHAP
jgi:mannosyltransferase